MKKFAGFLLVLMAIFMLNACSSPLWTVILKRGYEQQALDVAVKKGVELGYTPEYVDKESGLAVLSKKGESLNMSIQIQKFENDKFTVVGKDMSFIPDPYFISKDIEKIVKAMDKCCGTPE
jgi:hypothetical protein